LHIVRIPKIRGEERREEKRREEKRRELYATIRNA